MMQEAELDPYAAQLRLSSRAASTLSDEALVLTAVASGVSRLTADRVVTLTRGGSEAGRARAHAQSRPWTTPRHRPAG